MQNFRDKQCVVSDVFSIRGAVDWLVVRSSQVFEVVLGQYKFCYKIATLDLHLNGKKVLLIYRFTSALAPKNADLKLK